MKKSSQKWLAMLGLSLGVFMATLDSSIVNISLPTLVKELNTDFATVQWVILSYLLVLTSFMLGVARLGDMMDKKRIYMTGILIFSFSSLMCGLTNSVGWLIAFRALQGVGAVMEQSLGMALVTEAFPAKERGKAMGVIGGVVSMGIALGPPLGGILIGAFGWQSIFLVNVPIGLVTLLVVNRYVPGSKPVRTGERFDLAGAFILLVVMSSYGLGMTMGQSNGFADRNVLLLLGTAALGLGIFLFVEKRGANPMIDLSLFRSANFSFGLLMGFMVFIVLAGNFLFPFFLTLVKGYEVGQVGLMMMAQPVAMGLVGLVAGVLSDRFGVRKITLVGLLFFVAGCFGISTMNVDLTPWGFVLRLALLGVGFGIFQSPNNSAIMGAAPRHRLGIASGLLSLSRTLGQTTGLPLMGALFAIQVRTISGIHIGTDVTSASGQALVGGIAGTFRIAAMIGLLLVGMAIFALRNERNQANEAVI